MKNCGILGRKNGFSLIEMSIVIVIIGLITAASFSMLTANLDTTRYINTRDRAKEIITSLERFYAANNRLPCPAQGTLKLGDATYGQEIFLTAGIGLCDRAVTPANNTAPAGTSMTEVGTGSGKWIRQGTVPTRALGLPDSMMYDEYGNKFTYVVTEKFTSGSTNGVITVNDGRGNTISSSVTVAVISHGKDRKGAYTVGGTVGTACDATVRLDKENCNNDNVLTDTQFNDMDTANPAYWFDDVIRWADKSLITSLASASPSSPSGTGTCTNQLFTSDNTSFSFPSNATYPLTVRVFAVGAGGTNAHPQIQGGWGHVRSASVSVPSAGTYVIKVGRNSGTSTGGVGYYLGGDGYQGNSSGSPNFYGGGGGGSSAFGLSGGGQAGIGTLYIAAAGGGGGGNGSCSYGSFAVGGGGGGGGSAGNGGNATASGGGNGGISDGTWGAGGGGGGGIFLQELVADQLGDTAMEAAVAEA